MPGYEIGRPGAGALAATGALTLTCGRPVLAAVLGLHVLGAAAACVLPWPAALITLAGIAASAAGFLRQGRSAVALHCVRGLVLARLPEESGPGQHPVRVIPILGGLLLLLQIQSRPRRYRWIARGDLGEDDYRVLIVSARWPAHRTAGAAH